VVDTVAGPGFCPGEAVHDEISRRTRSVAVDAQGRVFFETGVPTAGLVARVDEAGLVTALVTGLGGGSQRRRLAADGKGGVFVATPARIVDIDAQNGATTVAGDPTAPGAAVGAGSSGDGGPVAQARFSSIAAMVGDGAGGLYVADVDAARSSVRIRFLNTTSQPHRFQVGDHPVEVGPGSIDTVVGGVLASSTSAGAAGGSGPLLAVAPDRLFFSGMAPGTPAPTAPADVRVMNIGGQAIAVNGVPLSSGSIAATARGEPVPAAMAADDQGNLYLVGTGTHQVRRVAPSGVATAFAGSDLPSARRSAGNERPALEASLVDPFDIQTGPMGRLYISDRSLGQIRVVDESGVIRAVPGGGVGESWNCSPVGRGDRPAVLPVPAAGPVSVAVGGRGEVLLALVAGNQVKRVVPGGMLATVAGLATSGGRCRIDSTGPCYDPSDEGALAARVHLDRPSAMTVDPMGGLYILDGAGTRVRFVNLGRRAVTVHGVRVGPGRVRTVVGPGTGGAQGLDVGPLELESPQRIAPRAATGLGPTEMVAFGSLAVDSAGNLFVADPAHHRVVTVDRRGLRSTFGVSAAGSAVGATGCCRDPAGLATDSTGSVFVVDKGLDAEYRPHPRVWFFNRTPRTVKVLGQTFGPGSSGPVAGDGTTGFAGDLGPALESPLLNPMGLTVDQTGNLYIAEGAGDVRRVNPDGTIITVVGIGQGGFNGDGLKAALTTLSFPTDVAVDRCGNLLVADLGNDRVRRVGNGRDCVQGTDSVGIRGSVGSGWRSLALGAALGLVATGVLVRRRRHRRARY